MSVLDWMIRIVYVHIKSSCFFLFLTSLPPKKKFLTVSKVYILVMCLFFLIGVRNRVILSFLFVLWFYYRFYSKKSPKILFLLTILGKFS